MKRLIIIQMLIGLLFCSNAMAQSDTTEIEVLNADKLKAVYDSVNSSINVGIGVELDFELMVNDSIHVYLLKDQGDVCFDYWGKAEIHDYLDVYVELYSLNWSCPNSGGEGEIYRYKGGTFFNFFALLSGAESTTLKLYIMRGTNVYELTLFNQLNHLYFAPPTNWNETWLYFNETWPSQETAEWPGIQLGTAKTSWIEYSFPEAIHGSSFVLHNGSGTQTQEMLVVGDTWVHIPDEYDVDSLGNVKVALYHEEPDLGIPVGDVEAITPLGRIYPNPTRDRLFLSGAGGSYQILDITGQLLAKGHLSSGSGIDVSAFSPGIYTISVDGMTTQKFIKE